MPGRRPRCGCHEPESGYADPRATTTAFMQRRSSRVPSCEKASWSPVYAPLGRVVGVDTNEGPIDAPIVVDGRSVV